MSKYELSISTGYVPDWGIVEACRELFQNALDNQIQVPENIASVEYSEENETLFISNKTSYLEKDSLLLGSSTKSDDKNTIGKHGEGYKIAFMVLLRNNKPITVYNYGKKEVWRVELVKSRRYNNKEVPVINVEKCSIWSRIPDNNLTIAIGNFTSDEYEELKKNNLHLRDEALDTIDVPNIGRLILNDEEAGNIYVKGLFVANKKEFTYGYDFEPSVISLDRDRKLVDGIKLAFETSALWNVAIIKNPELKEKFLSMFKSDTIDVRYSTRTFSESYENSSEIIAADFASEYGEDAVPVTNNEEYHNVLEYGKTPIIVNNGVAEAIKQSSFVNVINADSIKTLNEKFKDFRDKIAYKLNDDELDEFNMLINKINN